MDIAARLDIDVVAVEAADELTAMLELTAPPLPGAQPRPPATVQVVLDRSGSMAGERLDAALAALCALVDRLDPADRLGVVAFDDAVDVVVPCGAVADKAALRAAVRAIRPGGMTNLSAGLLRGLQEARRAAGAAGATVLLVSDGHANAGEVDPSRLAAVAAGARGHGITTTTVGIGLGYDERLLAELAAGGQGGHAFAEDGDGAAAALAGEVEGLLSKTVQAASITVRPAGDVAGITVWGGLPSHAVDDGVVVEVGDLWSGEVRKVLLTLQVPAMPALGLAQVAELELRHVLLPAFVEEVVTVPLHVNVVPGDQAAGRIPDPQVRTELLFQRAQEAKRAAADAIERGDHEAATLAFRVAAADLRSAPAAPPELLDEALVLEHLASVDPALSAKRARAEHARKGRQRGR
jgi:Ca-activated chloride channel homolog